MSGEIIALSDMMSMIFETMDLSQASPATVSRCGMIYLEPSQLGWEPHVESWLSTRPEFVTPHLQEILKELLYCFIPAGINFVQKSVRHFVDVADVMYVHSLFRLLDGHINTDFENESNIKVCDTWAIPITTLIYIYICN